MSSLDFDLVIKECKIMNGKSNLDEFINASKNKKACNIRIMLDHSTSNELRSVLSFDGKTYSYEDSANRKFVAKYLLFEETELGCQYFLCDDNTLTFNQVALTRKSSRLKDHDIMFFLVLRYSK